MDTVNASYRDTITGKTTKTTGNYNAVFTDKKDKSVTVDDFLKLMVAQLANQDFMNPVDDTQYISQLAQFATMKQMQDLASYSKSNYVMSLIGKEVTAAKMSVSGNVEKVTGPVEKVSLVNNEYTIYVGGKPYTLEQIMEINGVSPTKPDTGEDTKGLSVTAKNVTSDSVELEWPSPSLSQGLKYSAYYSTNSNFDSVEDVEKSGIPIGKPDRLSLNTESLKGLASDTTYFVNVVVTHTNGIKSVYQKATFHTLGEVEEV